MERGGFSMLAEAEGAWERNGKTDAQIRATDAWIANKFHGLPKNDPLRAAIRELIEGAQ